MNNCFIILAGGESKRFNSKTPKPYHLYKGKPLLIHSINKAKNYKKFNKIATVTAVIPSARFGALDLKNERVKSFSEKPQSGEGWINGGFFCFKNTIFNYLKDDTTVLEETPLENLAKKKNLLAFKHFKYWQCMDTRRDFDLLNKLWKSKKFLWLR